VAAFGIAAALAAHQVARQALPAYGGRVLLPGIERPVQVTFGPHAVPHVRAETPQDLLVAQGFLVARERMWQMDMLRRLARGRLAEVLGPRLLPVDRMFRVLGLERAAEESLAAVDTEVRALLEAFADGVNRYLAAARQALPLEYWLVWATPEPWHPVDSLAVLEYMAFSLSFNARHELTFLKLAGRVGADRARELFPADEGLPAPAYAEELVEVVSRVGPVAGAVGAALALAPGLAAGASNSWALAGPRADRGLPLLANDPHLAPTVPALWYELELEAPGYHAAGISLPGVPFVLIGHNEDLAWGLTTAMADTQDVFLERLLPGGQTAERADGGREPVGSRVEAIRVRGEDRPVEVRVRHTSNGVVLNDLLAEPAGTPQDFPTWHGPYLLTLRSSLETPDRSLRALYDLNRSRGVEELLAAAHGVRHAAQKLMYAHRDGALGWYVTGAIPLRARGLGAFPVPAWTGGYGWTGYLPEAANPAVARAGPAGYLVAANDRALPEAYPWQVGSTWMAPYRAARLHERLAGSARLSPGDLAALQHDVLSVEVSRYRAALERLAPALESADPEAARLARRWLSGWDGRFEPDDPAAAFFVRLRPRLAAALLEDELGEDLRDLLAISALAYNGLQEVVASGRSSFWDDVRTPRVEGPAEIWARALRATARSLGGRDRDLERARLDRVRGLLFAHAFHWVPALGPLFDVGPLEVRGDDHTVSVMKGSLLEPDSVQFVPSYRVVLTPGDWTRTRGTNTLGQSGHRLSPHRTDQLADWVAGRTHPWSWGGPRGGSVLGRLSLEPE
jgi:acyl-homoserine lactone acylase PvdQ